MPLNRAYSPEKSKMEIPRFGVVFDLDDTLISTSPVYYQIYAKFLHVLYKDMDPYFITPGEVWEVFKLIEKGELIPDVEYATFHDFVGEHNYFEKSLIQTYVECCVRSGVLPKEASVNKIRGFTKDLYTRKYPFLDSAHTALFHIGRLKGIRMFLLTVGPEDLQRPKVTDRRSFRMFERVIILPPGTSKYETLKNLREEFDTMYRWYMVGDSIPSDMNPALGNGYKALHVTRNASHIAEGELINVGSALQNYRECDSVLDAYHFIRQDIKDVRLQVREREEGISLTQGDISEHGDRT